MATVPKGAKQPTDRLKAEATASDDAEFTIDLNGTQIRVLHPLDWDKNATSALTNLNFAGWAAGAVHPDDVAKFNNTPATLRETMAALKDVEAKAGVVVGEYLAS
ncbi:MAG: hypothetical protein ACXVGC_00115 [Mycobacteriaceae bacterium]